MEKSDLAFLRLTRNGDRLSSRKRLIEGEQDKRKRDSSRAQNNQGQERKNDSDEMEFSIDIKKNKKKG